MLMIYELRGMSSPAFVCCLVPFCCWFSKYCLNKLGQLIDVIGVSPLSSLSCWQIHSGLSSSRATRASRHELHVSLFFDDLMPCLFQKHRQVFLWWGPNRSLSERAGLLMWKAFTSLLCLNTDSWRKHQLCRTSCSPHRALWNQC